MSRKVTIILLLLFGIGIGVWFGYSINKVSELNTISVDTLQRKNDSLNNILPVIEKNLEDNRTEYEKNCSIIINQSVDSDIQFLSDYLSKNRKRLDSINNNRSVKGN